MTDPVPTGLTTVRDDDLRRIVSCLRRAAPTVLSCAMLAGGAAYLLTTRQSPTYAAESSLITLRDDGGGGVLRDTVFRAPPVQLGALQEALRTPDVLQDVRSAILGSALPKTSVRQLEQDVRTQLLGGPAVLEVEVRGKTPQDSSVYEITSRAATPQGAQTLADAGASALLRWDADRAERRLAGVRARLESQLDVLNVRLSNNLTAATSRARLERQSLTNARDQVLQNLAQATALERSTGSVFERLGAASPARSLSNSPLKVGGMAALLTLFLLAGAVLLFDRLRRRVFDEHDLQGWGVPLLAQLPALDKRTSQQSPVSVTAGLWRHPLGFLRVNVLSQLGAERPRRVVIASTRPAEGKSMVTAALAVSLAAHGERVLIVDADTEAASQATLWQLNSAHFDRASQLSSSIGSLAERIPVADGIDLLLPTALCQADGELDYPQLNAWLSQHADAYDTVLFDAPPLLSSPHAVTLALHSVGMVLIAVPGRTSYQDLEATFAAAHTAQVRVLGLVLNRRPALTHSTGQSPRPEVAKHLPDSEEFSTQ